MMMPKKVTVQKIISKKGSEKIVMITAYDYTIARIVDAIDTVDIILVGDSLGMTVLGFENTLGVTMEDMERHTQAVARAVKRALLVADMPFLSFQVSTEKAIENAGRLLQAGANAVKIEGASENILKTIKELVSIGIPVMGHLGFTPQSIHAFGGPKFKGKTVEEAKRLIEDAKKLEEAGVFAIVLELVPQEVAKIITEKVSIPTIGIGSGKYCDGEVQVINDILGLNPDFHPKHSKTYINLYQIILDTVQKYAKEVKEGLFPTEENTFLIGDPETLKKIMEEI